MPCIHFNPDNDIPDLTDRVIIVTGGNAGLGLETIPDIKRLQDDSGTELRFTSLSLDLSSFASIKAAAETFKRNETHLGLFINNIGIIMTTEGLTEDGYEIQFGTNVMGPAFFTLRLLPLLRSTARHNPHTRVVNLASPSEGRAPADIHDFISLKTPMTDKHATVRYTTSKIADIHYTSRSHAASQTYNS
ncbi:hypothetical protein SVAN01_07426 [Stagonosporopsis vannaccii]|nr:hypothetical protein SVAN01_07426 [Stagonosporopsis vannaccii]